MNELNTPAPLRSFAADNLQVGVYENRRELGKAAAAHVVNCLEKLQAEQEEVRMVVASAPSQNEFFEYLTTAPLLDRIDWEKVVVFHMDEYVGLAADHPQSFRAYQQEHFLSKASVKRFHGIGGEAEDLEAECQRLSALLSEKPIDLICCGIGENGHLAFNDPPVADFEDPRLVKVVAMDEICRQQQVNDGCFPNLDAVPTHAITLTLPVFAKASALACMVPAATKAQAVAATIKDPVSTACPSTMLRNHPQARLFLDRDSASRLD